jgi:RNA-dependent RNA polymerase
MVDAKRKIDSGERNIGCPKRGVDLPIFIMDHLTKFAKQECANQIDKVEDHFGRCSVVLDTDLIEPWLSAEKMADRFLSEEGSDRMKRDLKKISDHVSNVYNKHRAQLRQLVSPKKKDGAQFTNRPIETRQDTLRALSKEFVSKPTPDEVLMDESQIRRARASYAYYYDYLQAESWTRFPWDVAMSELCTIKGAYHCASSMSKFWISTSL